MVGNANVSARPITMSSASIRRSWLVSARQSRGVLGEDQFQDELDPRLKELLETPSQQDPARRFRVSTCNVHIVADEFLNRLDRLSHD